MSKMTQKLLAVLALVLLSAAPILAEEAFDLKINLDLSDELTSSLREGDVLQFVLRPQTQWGERAVPGEPVVMKTIWTRKQVVNNHINFRKALEPDQIYRLEMRVVRSGKGHETQSVRYLSSLYKLPRKPVAQPLTMRLHLSGKRDARQNLVLVTRDADGVYRLMLFTA